MSEPARLFTVADANRLVPFLERTFVRLRARRDELAELVTSLQEMGYDFTDEAKTNLPEGSEAETLLEQCLDLQQHIISSLNELSDLGVEVKGLDGLVDVRSRYRGRIVYLCWREGEESFSFWHELDAGFAGRLPITEPELFEGSLLN